MLQQPFRFRPGIVDSVDPEEFTGEGGRTARRDDCARQGGLFGGITGAILVCVAMWPTLLEMTTVWRTHEAYQYAWLVLPMVVYLLGWHPR